MAEINVELKKYNEASGQFDTMLPRPMKHASTHSQFGDDPITPDAIGALSAKAKAESAKIADDVVGISASKITSGVLPVNKGGTGVTTIEAIKNLLGVGSFNPNFRIEKGSILSDEIAYTKKPLIVFIYGEDDTYINQAYAFQDQTSAVMNVMNTGAGHDSHIASLRLSWRENHMYLDFDDRNITLREYIAIYA